MAEFSMGNCVIKYKAEGGTLETLGYQHDDQETNLTFTVESHPFGARGFQGPREIREGAKECVGTIPITVDYEQYAKLASNTIVDNLDGTFTMAGAIGALKKTFELEFRPKHAIDETQTLVLHRAFIDIDENYVLTEDGRTTLTLKVIATEGEANGFVYSVGAPIV